MEDTLTLMRLEVKGTLLQSLQSTNAIESLNDKIASYTRRVKRWQGGKMILRWVGAAILDARKGFRGVRGLKDMPTLVEALRRHEERTATRWWSASSLHLAGSGVVTGSSDAKQQSVAPHGF